MRKQRRRGGSLSERHSKYGYVFVLPFIIGFLFFTLSPILLYVVMGFQKVTAGDSGIVLTGVGWQNYIDLFYSETNFLPKVTQSLSDMALNGLFIVIFSLFVATVLNQNFACRGLVRTIFFLPIVTASGVAGMVMSDGLAVAARDALNTEGAENGLFVGAFMSLMGNLLDDGYTVFLTDLIDRFYSVVQASSVQILIFLAGLQTISPSLYEAADIDGATSWESYWKITFPMISPVILVNTVYTVVDQLNNTDNPVIATLYQYAGEGVKYGLGSAMGTVYFGIVLILIALVIWILSRGVVYEE